MYKCQTCGRKVIFEEIANLGRKNFTKEEFMKLGKDKARVNFRCPHCDGKTFEKARPKTTRIVKAR